MIKLSVFKCSPYLFRGNRIFIYIHADCIENCISNRWCDTIHGNFCHSLQQYYWELKKKNDASDRLNQIILL